jgi:RimJ/RimL family protein N-acetyltransferase
MPSTHRGVSLRAVREDDMGFLHGLFTDPDRCHLWMRGRRVLDEREFHQAWISWSAEMMAAKFIVLRDSRPIGLIFDYDRVAEAGITKVTTLLLDDEVDRGAGVIASALFMDWLFTTSPFRVIYLEVFGYNPKVVGFMRKLGFAEEAVMKRNRFWNGAYWDLHTLAAHREHWPDVRARILGAKRTATGQVDGLAGSDRTSREHRVTALARGRSETLGAGAPHEPIAVADGSTYEEVEHAP